MALGDTWNTVETPAGRMNAFCILGSGRIVAVGFDGIALYSDDDGETWSQGTTPNSENLLSPVQSSSGRVFTAAQDSFDGTADIIYSDDEGETWQGVSTAYIMQVYSITITPSGRIIAAGVATDVYDMQCSDDDGASWSPLSDNGVNNLFQSLEVLADGRLMAVADAINGGSSNGAFVSDDDGDTWAPINFFDNEVWTSVVHVPASVRTLVSLEGSASTDDLVVSTDNAVTWQNVGEPAAQQGPLSLLSESDVLWAPDGEELFLSKDGGQTWTQVYDHDVMNPSFPSFDIGIRNSRPHFAVKTSTGKVFVAVNAVGYLMWSQGEAAAPPAPPDPWWTGYEGVSEIRRA